MSRPGQESLSTPIICDRQARLSPAIRRIAGEGQEIAALRTFVTKWKCRKLNHRARSQLTLIAACLDDPPDGVNDHVGGVHIDVVISVLCDDKLAVG